MFILISRKRLNRLEAIVIEQGIRLDGMDRQHRNAAMAATHATQERLKQREDLNMAGYTIHLILNMIEHMQGRNRKAVARREGNVVFGHFGNDDPPSAA